MHTHVPLLGLGRGLDLNPPECGTAHQSIPQQAHVASLPLCIIVMQAMVLDRAFNAEQARRLLLSVCQTYPNVTTARFPFSSFSHRGVGCGLVPCPLSCHWRRFHVYKICAGVGRALGKFPGFVYIPVSQKVTISKNSFHHVLSVVLKLLLHGQGRCSQSHPLRGVRIGEASHPGPYGGSDITFAVINPTAILNKADLVSEVGAQVILASETSATALTQQTMRGPLRSKGYQSFWGNPVPEQLQTKTGVCRRGLSIGTAVFSQLPARPAIRPYTPEQIASCRISECFVRAGPLEIKVVVVYGWPSSTHDAAARNNLLLAWAFERVTACSLPALIGGDFNMLPQTLPAWECFAQQGWVEAGSYVQQVFGVNLPNTCKQATRNDTFLLPPVLQQYLVHADVLTEALLFDAHSPMRLKFRFPGKFETSLQWRLPRTFADFGPSLPELDEAYKSFANFSSSLGQVPDAQAMTALRTWSQAVEDSVSQVLAGRALKEPHLQWPGQLPASYSGRCKVRERVARIIPQAPKAARAGHPQPQSETTSVRARQKLRQWRRLHVLLQGVRKLAVVSQGPAYTVLLRNLLQQWQSIQRAPGYVGGFLAWILDWPEFSMVPITLPDVAYITQLLQVVKFDYEAFAAQEAKVKRDTYRYQVTVDAAGRSASPSFVRIKPQPPESLQRVQVCVEGQAHQVEVFSWHRRAYSASCAASLLLNQPVQVAGTTAQLYQAVAGQIKLIFAADDDIVLPPTVHIRQEQFDCSPQGVVGALVNYWSEFWNRDSCQAEWDLEQWPHFRDIVQGLTSPCSVVEIDMNDLSAWLHATHRLPKRKATGPGVCGWHNTDLRLLPPAAVRDLMRILNSPALSGFPPELMLARVAVLGKVASPTLPSQSRPITIMSNLFRLWARVFCQQIISVWSLTLPQSIRGCLKGRCAQDISYGLQQVAESHILANEPCSGLVLDLRKAFNLLPRSPIGHLMQLLGVPGEQVEFWLKSLSRLQRLFQVRDHLGAPLPSTTGVPEGDPISVLGMISLHTSPLLHM